jgi:hypothetical protein
MSDFQVERAPYLITTDLAKLDLDTIWGWLRGSYWAAGIPRATIQSHPELQGLRRFVLATRDAHGLYAQFGFHPLAHPETFMEIVQPDIYRSAA